MAKKWTDLLPDVFGRRRIFELECQLEEAQGEIEELVANSEVVSADFEKDCWRSMRRLLDRCKFDWRDVGHDGVTADEAEEFIRETIDDLTQRVERALSPSPQTNLKSDVEAQIASVVQSVNEWDDRTSPEDYPEHLLITSNELADILRNFAAAIATEGR